MGFKEKWENFKDGASGFWHDHCVEIIAGCLLTGWAVTTGLAYNNGYKQGDHNGFHDGFKRGFDDANHYFSTATKKADPEAFDKVQAVLDDPEFNKEFLDSLN